MCFGSEYSPPTAHQAELLFAAIKRTDLDVLYVGPAGSSENTEIYGGSMDSAEAVYAEEMSKMGKRGLVAEWVPQYKVLEHKVSFRHAELGPKRALPNRIQGKISWHMLAIDISHRLTLDVGDRLFPHSRRE